jgi:hypothetical protein
MKPLEKLMNAYCTHKKCAPSSMEFKFNSRILALSDTCHALGIVAKSIIEARIK